MRERVGSIDVTSTGRLRVRATTNSGERKTYGIFDTEEDANRARMATVSVFEESDGGARTVGKWIADWLDARELERRIVDIYSDRNRFKNHIQNDEIASIPLTKLKRADVLAWLARVRAKPGRKPGSRLGRQTVLNTLQILHGALREALNRELVKADVTVGIKIKRERRVDETWTVLTPAEQAALLAACRKQDRPIVAFAIGTGLRAGEIVSLKTEDVHIDDPSPHVIVRYGNRKFGPTKGGKPRRVELFGLALDAAIAWRKGRKTWCAAAEKGVFFQGVRGAVRNEKHVLDWQIWDKARVASGIKKHFRWHDLRHTCASALISGEWGRMWSLSEVQNQLGHLESKTTERYAHFAGTALTRAGDETRKALAVVSLPAPTSVESKPEAPKETASKTTEIVASKSAKNGSSNRPSIGHGGDGADPIGGQILLEPISRLELETYGLRNRCSTTELNRQKKR